MRGNDLISISLNIDIVTGYPSWFILGCVFAGILAAMILYFRERRSELPVWVKRLLGVTRFIVVALIAFLLLSPLLKKISRTEEKPIIVVAMDNSLSLMITKDSVYYREEWPQEMNQLLEQLSDRYDISLFTFGETLNAVEGPGFDTLMFNERYTDMASVFDMMDVRYANRNIGALIIAGDGVFNRGMNPVYHPAGVNYPVYTIALGDTSVRKDAYFKRLLYNRIAFEGNDFPVEAIVNAGRMNGATVKLLVTEGGKEVLKEQFRVDGNNFSRTFRLQLTAGEPGMHHYVIRLSTSENEVTTANNRSDLFIDVLKSKQKVLILANSPHPDISALKTAISSNMNYEVEDFLIREFNGPLDDFSLVILHQLPSSRPESRPMLERIRRMKLPVLYVIGPQTNFSEFNRMNAGMIITPYNAGRSNEVLPVLEDGFSLFRPGDELRRLIPDLPPLTAPFARYNTVLAARVLLSQKVGSVESRDPLWMLHDDGQSRNGVICGSGLWKWRMKTWLETGRHNAFNELVNKSIQYLAEKDDKRRFRVSSDASIPENETVELSAELYNQSMDPYNDPDVNLLISDEQGNTYDYVFGRNARAYLLNAGTFPVGTYTYRASVNEGTAVLEDEGGFTVMPVNIEKVALQADHALLQKLAQENDGRLIPADSIAGIPPMLEARGDVKPLLHAEKKYIAFIDIWWILLIILGLLGLEWFLRKWSGSY